MAGEQAKTTAELLAGIRPKEVDEDEEQLEEQEAAGDGDQDAGDGGETDADQDAGDGGGDKPKPKPAAKKPEPTAKDAADQYFARQRKRTKDLAVELEAERGERLRLQRQMEDMQRRIDAGFAPQPAAAKEDGNPHDPDDRPVEHARWEAEKARKEVEALRGEISQSDTKKRQIEQQAEQEQSIARYARQVDDELGQAFQEVPAFGGMYSAYNDAVINHYVGQGLDRQAATRQATMDHLRVAHAGSQRGMTPAQAIYEQAARLGFDPNVFAPQPATPAAAASGPNLDGARQASRRAPRSINGAPGASGGRVRSIEALAAKRDKDWEKKDASGLFRALRDKAGAW